MRPTTRIERKPADEHSLVKKKKGPQVCKSQVLQGWFRAFFFLLRKIAWLAACLIAVQMAYEHEHDPGHGYECAFIPSARDTVRGGPRARRSMPLSGFRVIPPRLCGRHDDGLPHQPLQPLQPPDGTTQHRLSKVYLKAGTQFPKMRPRKRKQLKFSYGVLVLVWSTEMACRLQLAKRSSSVVHAIHPPRVSSFPS